MRTLRREQKVSIALGKPLSRNKVCEDQLVTNLDTFIFAANHHSFSIANYLPTGRLITLSVL